jgi:hypothetical protein
MDTAAACRTYNVLLSEDRRVVAALLAEAAEYRRWQTACRFCRDAVTGTPSDTRDAA